MEAPSHLSDWIEALPAEGRYTFTRADAEAASGTSFVATQSALRRLGQSGTLPFSATSSRSCGRGSSATALPPGRGYMSGSWPACRAIRGGQRGPASQ